MTKRVKNGLLIMLCVGGVGMLVASVFVWRRITCPVSGGAEREERALRFVVCLAGQSTSDDGLPVSFTRFRSSAGIPVELRLERRPSPELTREALEKRLKGAVAVLQRQPVTDTRGNVVGERIVAVFPSPWEAVVLVIEGSKLQAIHSPSIRHVLEFERSPEH